MRKVKFSDCVEYMIKGPFGSDMKKSLYVPKGDNTYKVYIQVNAIQRNQSLGEYYVSEEYFHKKLERFEVHPGDYLITCDGTLGKFIKLDENSEKGVISSSLLLLKLKEEVIYDKYFELIWEYSMLGYLASQARNACLVHLPSAKAIGDVEIILPDLAEQIELADRAFSVSNIVEKRKTELALLDNLIKARFVEMFGTPYGNEKGFPMKTVDDVIEFTGGSQPDKKYFEYEPSEDNIRLIQIRDYKTDKYITYIPKSMAKRFCNVDDIMIGRYGPPIFQILKGIEGSYNVALMKATPKMGNKEFVRHFLMQDCLFNYLDGLSQRTAGQSGIEMPALKAYPFPYPPIDLQNEFENFAEQVDKSKVAVQKALDEAQLLFDSLMQEYFG